MPVQYESAKLKSWASIYDAGTLLQAERCSRLPFVYDHVALMPDAHVGMGATVGSVIPTEGAIIPAAVGVDIGCGMIASLTSLSASDLPDDLSPLMPLVESRIPAGVGQGHDKYTNSVMTKVGQPLTKLTPRQEATMWTQFGTLGSGNHFVEVCLDTDDRVWTVLHSGSRGIGNQLANIHIKMAKAQEQGLEDPDLAYFLQDTPEFNAYIHDMMWAQDYAFGSRQKMANALNKSLFEVCSGVVHPTYMHGKVLDTINCHHNFTIQEKFNLPEGQKTLWITRKGAIQARTGDRGVIPGSMGTKSYIVRGKGVSEAWCSCSHGAGRVMSRSQAKRELSTSSLNEMMAGKVWNSNKSDALLDEHPLSYKDIDQVMEDQTDLVSVDAVLRQIFNYKGCK